MVVVSLISQRARRAKAEKEMKEEEEKNKAEEEKRAAADAADATMAKRPKVHFFCLFFARAIHSLRTFSFSFSFRRRNSGFGVTRQALLPPPHYGTHRIFFREKTSALSCLVDSTRIALLAIVSLKMPGFLHRSNRF